MAAKNKVLFNLNNVNFNQAIVCDNKNSFNLLFARVGFILLHPPKNLLVVPKRFVGDMVLTLALCKKIKQLAPDVNVGLVCPPYLKNLAERAPYLNHLIEGSARPLQILAKAKRADFDTALVLRSSLSQVLALKLKGIQVVGFDEQRLGPFWPRWGLGLNAQFEAPKVMDNTPHLLLLAKALKALGICEQPELETFDLSLPTEVEDANHVLSLLQIANLSPDDKIAAIHLTAASKEKYQPPEKWIEGVQFLQQAGFKLLAIGTKVDSAIHQHIAKLAGVEVIDFCGHTTLRQTTVLLANCQLLFGHDSGPVHLAAAAKTPNIVTLYGPINHLQWQPYPYTGNFSAIYNENLTCRPCFKKSCGHNRCRTEITAQQIRQALVSHVERFCLA